MDPPNNTGIASVPSILFGSSEIGDSYPSSSILVMDCFFLRIQVSPLDFQFSFWLKSIFNLNLLLLNSALRSIETGGSTLK
jgi:hypothetical protein